MIHWIATIILGLIAGFIASKIVNKEGEGMLLNILLGLVGAVVGRWIFGLLRISVGGGIIWSLIVAVIGAVVVLLVYHAIRKAH